MFKMYNLLLLMVLSALVVAGTPYIHHNLMVTLEPQQQSFQATDSITIPAPRVEPEITFLLNSNLQISSQTPGVHIKLDKSNITAKDLGMDREDVQLSSRISVNRYIVTLSVPPGEDAVFAVKFGGEIHYPIQQMGEEYARAFSQTPGIISDEGVFLSGSTYWVPWFDDELINFMLTTTLPEKWDVVSQGKRTLHDIRNGSRITCWNSPEPMEEIYLIAARFTEYSRAAGAVNVMAFLRTPDENLANKYLETTAQYLEMYRKLIGPYPFSKFALVENFWETGYGMPSFTLLGEKIIRFPFILHSSYPHELLHNYWGNSVYVDFNNGNWCEGLTAYMADHLIKEQRGQGADYRRSTLQKYTDYVNPSNDFPLKEFISRHDAPSEAVGYGKCLMMWDMLRGQVGDEQFVKGFQNFYRNYKFKVASFDDIRKSFESVTDRDFRPFFKQWVERTGAPQLSLSDVGVDKTAGGYKLSFKLAQLQKEAPFTLAIPVTVSFEEKVEINRVEMSSKEQSYEMTFPQEPLLVQVDPQFNIFRRLNYNEIPPSLSKIFGSDEILILLPSRAPAGELETYRKLADKWAKDSSKKIEVGLDNEIQTIPADKAVWVFGAQNIFRKTIEKALSDYDAELGDEEVRLGKSSFTTANNSFIISVRHPQNPNSVLVLLISNT
ncbi:MAG: M1 family metallopeptidase, partial [Calditrichia bacterium]